MKIIDFIFEDFVERKNLYKKIKFGNENPKKGHIFFSLKENIVIKKEFIENKIEQNNTVSIWLNKKFFTYLLKQKILSPELNNLKKEKINIEYCSVNPTGKMHIGNVRNVIVGNLITKVFLFFGLNTTSYFYVNDMGGQIDEILNSDSDSYKESKEIIKKYNLKSKNETIDFFLNIIKEQIKKYNSLFNEYVYESEIYSNIYPKTEFWYFIKPFIVIQNGRKMYFDSKLNIYKHLYKSDNVSPTYFLTDLMLIYHKKNLFNKMIMVIGDDHNLHANLLRNFVEIKNINLTIKEISFVYLEQKNSVSFSKRKNTTVLFEDLNLDKKRNFLFRVLKNTSNTSISLNNKSLDKEVDIFFSIFNLEPKSYCEKDLDKKEIQILLTLCCFEQTLNYFLITLEPSHILRHIEKLCFFYNKIIFFSSNAISNFIFESIKKIKKFLTFILISI